MAIQPRPVTKTERAGQVLAFTGFVALPTLLAFAIYITVRKR